MTQEKQYKISDEYLFDFFGLPTDDRTAQDSFSYAITPYVSKEEYERDKESLRVLNTSTNPQDKMLIIHAAKVERTDKYILGLR